MLQKVANEGGSFNILYAGNIGFAQNLNLLLKLCEGISGTFN